MDSSAVNSQPHAVESKFEELTNIVKTLNECTCPYVAMTMSSNGNIFRVNGLLCGEFTDHRLISLTKAPSCPLWRHRNAALYFWWPCCMRYQNILRHNNVRVPFIPKSPIGWSHKSGPHWVHIDWCQDIEHLPSGPKCARWAKHLGWDIHLNGHTSCRPKWCMCRSLVIYHHIDKWNITEVGISNNEMYMA